MLTAHRGGAVMIAQVTPIAFAHSGWKFYIVFAICGFTNAIFFWVRHPALYLVRAC